MIEPQIKSLLALPRETEWIELKENNANPQDIGEYISAVANSAALHGQETGFIIWGIQDGSNEIVGTTFQPRRTKVGNEELENWLAVHLIPRLHFRVHEVDVEDHGVVVFEVPAASHTPVRFQEYEWIRVGTYKKRLKDHPEKERELWAILSRMSFEKGPAKTDITEDQAISLLDYPKYFELTGHRLPDVKKGIVDRLLAERLLARSATGVLSVTNMGALLFAKNLEDFETLARKAVRVVLYDGNNRVKTLREQLGRKGYAVVA
jgi:predicted HTH transcriptional regulator